MTTDSTREGSSSLWAQYAWVAGFLVLRTHYFLTVIVGPALGWR